MEQDPAIPCSLLTGHEGCEQEKGWVAQSKGLEFSVRVTGSSQEQGRERVSFAY